MRARLPASLALALLAGPACVTQLDPLAGRSSDEPRPDDPDPDDPDPDDPPPIDGDACDAHRATLDAIIAAIDVERTDLQIPGAAVAIVIDDCLVARGLGVEQQGGAAVNEHTRFQLASLTKTLTAMTALSLEQDGVLDRDLPLSTWIDTTSTASLDDLLAHRAGYPTDVPGYDDDLGAFVDQNAAVSMWAPPGEVWLYSNPGFAVAGRALEVAAGEDFAALVRARVFERAGMQDAVMGAELSGQTPGQTTGFATGHSGSASSPELIGPTDIYLTTGYYGPMGGAFASAADLAQLMHAMNESTVLSDASLDDMGRSRGPAYNASVGYGQGLFSYYDGTISHGGSVAGFLCEMDVHREAKVGIAVLSAADWSFPYQSLYEAIYALWPEAPTPPDDDAPSEADIVGSYHDDVVLGDVTIADTGGALRITLEGETHELSYWGPGVYGFFYPPWQMEIDASFQRGEAGTLYLVTLLGVASKT